MLFQIQKTLKDAFRLFQISALLLPAANSRKSHNKRHSLSSVLRTKRRTPPRAQQVRIPQETADKSGKNRKGKKNEKTRPATLAFFDKKIHEGRATFFALL